MSQVEVLCYRAEPRLLGGYTVYTPDGMPHGDVENVEQADALVKHLAGLAAKKPPTRLYTTDGDFIGNGSR